MDEKGILITSPQTAEELLNRNEELKHAMVICMWAAPETALIVRSEDWDRMIDDAETWVKSEQQ